MMKSTLYHRRQWHGINTPFLTFCLPSYLFSINISLLFLLFFLNLTCLCPYSYNLILTATYMCRRDTTLYNSNQSACALYQTTKLMLPVGFTLCRQLTETTVREQTCRPTGINYPDSEPTSLCIKYQFYSLWFIGSNTGTRIPDPPFSSFVYISNTAAGPRNKSYVIRQLDLETKVSRTREL